jgi:DNA polymerase-3 subunit gamma/tau
VAADAVREMLGLAERGRTVRLLLAVVDGNTAATLAEAASAHEAGAEPLAILKDLLGLVHALTLARVGGSLDERLPEAERALLAPVLERLRFPALHRLWQLLLKGHGEVATAPHPRDALDMALLRAAHAAGLPGPEEIVGLLERGGAAGALPTGQVSRPAAPADFEALVRLFEARNEPMLARLLHDKVACVAFAHGAVTLAAEGPLPRDFAGLVAARLGEWTGAPWTVELAASGGRSLFAEAAARQEEMRASALSDPTVKALLDAFPDGQVTVRPRNEEEAA